MRFSFYGLISLTLMLRHSTQIDFFSRKSKNETNNFVVFFAEKLAEIEVPEFHGDSYLVLPISDNLSTQTSIEVWFLTKSVNGKH